MGARVKFRDGRTPMPDGIYIVQAAVQETGNNDTYTVWVVRIRNTIGIRKITCLYTAAPNTADSITPNLYFGGTNNDELSITTMTERQNYTVCVTVTLVAA